jgi:hypothetical protein
MELIQSFIAIAETAANQQALQKNTNSTVRTHQPPQSPESATVEALLFNKPVSVEQTAAQNNKISYPVAVPQIWED